MERKCSKCDRPTRCLVCHRCSVGNRYFFELMHKLSVPDERDLFFYLPSFGFWPIRLTTVAAVDVVNELHCSVEYCVGIPWKNHVVLKTEFMRLRNATDDTLQWITDRLVTTLQTRISAIEEQERAICYPINVE